MRKIVFVVIFVCVILPLIILLNADMMMWEVENGSNKVYLLGSIHVMPEDVYPLDEQIEAAFEQSDILVVELDPGKIDQAEMNNLIISTGFYPEETSLKEEIPEELYNSIVPKFQEMGMTEAQFSRFRPWFVSISLGMGALQKLDIKAGKGIDMHFLDKAHEKQLTILDLETPTAQMEALSSMQEDTQIDYLQYMIDDYDNINEGFNEMLTAWKTGDADLMNKSYRLKLKEMESEFPGIKEYYQKILPDRDKRMVEQIKVFLENEEELTYFIIVGAFHLVGDDGMLQLLNDNGYTTKQF
ncbi:TraB/GumN family protein [Candidatus Cloacimonadota bacterium]